MSESTPSDDDRRDAENQSESGRPEDERESTKEHVDRTGEPERDALGNEDGAS